MASRQYLLFALKRMLIIASLSICELCANLTANRRAEASLQGRAGLVEEAQAPSPEVAAPKRRCVISQVAGAVLRRACPAAHS